MDFLFFQKNFNDAKAYKIKLQQSLVDQNIESYFQIQSFDEYPFVKEVLEQFVSDKLIFFLVGFIIFIVALSNVAFLMQLLVRDKSSDMAILRSLGASANQIQKIFIISGLFMGFVSALISLLLCFLTLHYIQPILTALSYILGQSVNLSQFYGIADHVSIDVTATLVAFTLSPLLCAAAAFFATNKIRKKTALEFLKEHK